MKHQKVTARIQEIRSELIEIMLLYQVPDEVAVDLYQTFSAIMYYVYNHHKHIDVLEELQNDNTRNSSEGDRSELV